MSDIRRRRKYNQSCGSDDLSDSYEELNATKETQAMSEVCFFTGKKPKMTKKTTDTKHLFDPETQNFAEISKKPTFVDHSLLNEIFFETGRKLFVSAPKMFCKSSNMNMIKHFFEIDKEGKVEPDWKKRPQYEIFKDKDIVTKGKEEDLKNHLGAYPVLFVDFKGPTIRKYEDALAHCYRKIKDAFRRHKVFLLKNIQDKDDRNLCKMWFESKTYQDVGKQNVKSGLTDLCEYLYQAHEEKRVLVLIDEYDAVVVSTLRDGTSGCEVGQIAQLMSTILCDITKGDIAQAIVQGVLLTGVSYISGVGYTQDVKTVACRFLDDTPDAATGFLRENIIPFYGLHEEQLDDILKKIRGSLKLSDDELERKKHEIKMGFNGFHTKIGQKCIYPLYTVAIYLISGKMLQVEAPPLLSTYVKVPAVIDIASDILKILGSGNINIDCVDGKINIKELIEMRDNPSMSSKDVFFMLLLEIGFLTYAESPECNDFRWKLRIPNQTTSKCFLKMLKTADVMVGKFNNALQEDCARHISNLQRYFLRRDIVNFRKTLILLYNDLKSLFKGFENQYPTEYSENSLQGLMFMVLSRTCDMKGFSNISSELWIKDNRGRNGIIDIWMFDKDRQFAIMWELKYNTAPRDKKKTSIYALKELRGQEKKAGKNDVVCYMDKFQQCKITEYFMVGLAMDEAYQPSISIATSKIEEADAESFICISETETENYKELYHHDKCIDLLRTS